MKRIFVSQRVDILTNINERRDALDQRWVSFLRETGGELMAVPNDKKSADFMLKSVAPDGIVLTGGNDPVANGGNAPERDAIDILLIDYAIKNSIPLIGVCRGMQSILCYFGGTLKKVNKHVTVKHHLKGSICREVNSYHNFAADFVPAVFKICATSEDCVIEAIKHSSIPILAMMWHPEREAVFNNDDIILFNKMWNRVDGVQ